tara:strand:+ start:1225 stop:2073 length:849 start_codon:yes stop_codon:yes gene_type:complete
MNKKLNIKFIQSFLKTIKNKPLWLIDKLLLELEISEKELFYVLTIISDIYTTSGETFIDYEINEDRKEINFNLSENVSEFLSINDGELFNIYFLLSTDANLLSLQEENKSIKEFSNILANYFTLESTDYEEPLRLAFNDQLNVIEYIKLGSTNSIYYKIKPITLKSNSDGIILEALDVDENLIKSFLVARIVNITDDSEYLESSKIKTNSIKVEFDLLDENFLNKLGSRIYKCVEGKLHMEFYSYENALDYAIKNLLFLQVAAPSELLNDINIRKNNLMEML